MTQEYTKGKEENEWSPVEKVYNAWTKYMTYFLLAFSSTHKAPREISYLCSRMHTCIFYNGKKAVDKKGKLFFLFITLCILCELYKKKIV